MARCQLAKEIISKREECKLTQFELSEILDCDERRIRRFESMDEEKVYSYIEFCVKLENFLGKSLMEIFNQKN